MTQSSIADAFQAGIVVKAKVASVDDGLCAGFGSNLVEKREVAANISYTSDAATRSVDDVGRISVGDARSSGRGGGSAAVVRGGVGILVVGRSGWTAS